jgi:hypothetical protein
MVWIIALVAAWLGACVLLTALARAAARSDRPTADHLALLRSPRLHHGLWLPPRSGGDDRP